MLSTDVHLRPALRTLLACVALVVTWFGGAEEAQAATYGMCSQDAQSIAAPPPMFPADDSSVSPCEAEHEFSWSIDTQGAPPDRLIPVSAEHEDRGVLSDELIIGPATSQLRPLSNCFEGPTQEFRLRGLRPPQALRHI